MAARLALRIPKLWYLSNALRVCQMETPLLAPNRGVTAGKEHMRLKHSKSEKHHDKGDHKVLDKFVGKWVEDRRHNYENVIEAAGLKEGAKKFFQSKSEIAYSKHGDKWTMHLGNVGGPPKVSYHFKLGEPFHATSIDGSPMKSVVKQEGEKLLSHHEIQGNHKYTCDVVKEVKGNMMTAHATVKGVKTDYVFKKK